MMRRFAQVLGVSTAELLSREDNPGLLDDSEEHLLSTYRLADPDKQADILKVAEALAPFREFPRNAA